ncbi:MAG: hypothetical protein HFH60_06630 [Lachnospiraceae bacterium]|nr:hypothetical protein [Lachnospiraceae bacterium]
MATDKNILEITRKAGYEPKENMGIIVKYAPENLSAKIADFFSMEFYVLQLCQEELVLIPFGVFSTSKKEISLQIPYGDIKSVTVVEDGLNYQISITTDTDILRLTTQQKELSDFRSSGTLTIYSEGLKISSWHKENLDRTLEALKNIHQ